ncbi:MAG: zinc ribbon domain-containing protein [Phycisphaerae bacterium]|jgi:hypothetical protein
MLEDHFSRLFRIVVTTVVSVGMTAFLVFFIAIVFLAIRKGPRALSGGGHRRRRGRRAAINEWDPVCAQPSCGHVNPPAALFCARCGSPLNRWREIDHHG